MQASSDSGLLCSSSGALASRRCWIGEKVWPLTESWSTMWRWLNVPRSVSWPVRRLGVRPVDGRRVGVGERLTPAVELFGELGVHGEALGDRQQLLAERAQLG